MLFVLCLVANIIVQANLRSDDGDSGLFNCADLGSDHIAYQEQQQLVMRCQEITRLTTNPVCEVARENREPGHRTPVQTVCTAIKFLEMRTCGEKRVNLAWVELKESLMKTCRAEKESCKGTADALKCLTEKISRDFIKGSPVVKAKIFRITMLEGSIGLNASQEEVTKAIKTLEDDQTTFPAFPKFLEITKHILEVAFSQNFVPTPLESAPEPPVISDLHTLKDAMEAFEDELLAATVNEAHKKLLLAIDTAKQSYVEAGGGLRVEKERSRIYDEAQGMYSSKNPRVLRPGLLG